MHNGSIAANITWDRLPNKCKLEVGKLLQCQLPWVHRLSLCITMVIKLYLLLLSGLLDGQKIVITCPLMSRMTYLMAQPLPWMFDWHPYRLQSEWICTCHSPAASQAQLSWWLKLWKERASHFVSSSPLQIHVWQERVCRLTSTVLPLSLSGVWRNASCPLTASGLWYLADSPNPSQGK